VKLPSGWTVPVMGDPIGLGTISLGAEGERE